MRTKFIDKYQNYLKQTNQWILKSFDRGGGSAAHFSPLLGWSKPYPETTGYIIPTLINNAHYLDCPRSLEIAKAAGEWLLSIQDNKGYWAGGLHPPKGSGQASIFNTGQILKGMCALYRETNDDKWLVSASRGARWLADNVDENGIWTVGHYQENYQPVYYTRVAWPMLAVWTLNKNEVVQASAKRVLDWALTQQKQNGTFGGWGFKLSAPAFTHTIAYTLRGFLESARLLNDWGKYGEPMVKPLEKIRQYVELNNGSLAGTFDIEWKGNKSFSCMTGCAQIALCFMKLDKHNTDLRFVSAAAKLVDTVCKSQKLYGLPSLIGAVPGSVPLWGEYMIFRYPNWSAKFQADALLTLIRRLKDA